MKKPTPINYPLPDERLACLKIIFGEHWQEGEHLTRGRMEYRAGPQLVDIGGDVPIEVSDGDVLVVWSAH